MAATRSVAWSARLLAAAVAAFWPQIGISIDDHSSFIIMPDEGSDREMAPDQIPPNLTREPAPDGASADGGPPSEGKPKPRWRPITAQDKFPPQLDINRCPLETIHYGANQRAPTVGAPILVINLDERPDRWNAMKNASHVASVAKSRQLMRWSAQQLKSMDDVNNLHPRYRKLAMRKLENPPPNLAAQRDSKDETQQAHFFAVLSCYLSHLTAIKYLKENFLHAKRQADYAYLVMEDDFQFWRDILDLAPKVFQAVRDEEWDAIRLDCWGQGGFRWQRPPRLPKSWPNAWISRTNVSAPVKGGFGGSHAILYRRKALEKVYRYFLDEPLRTADDMFWTTKLRTYCVNWGIVKRLPSLGSNVSRTAGSPFHRRKALYADSDGDLGEMMSLEEKPQIGGDVDPLQDEIFRFEAKPTEVESAVEGDDRAVTQEEASALEEDESELESEASVPDEDDRELTLQKKHDQQCENFKVEREQRKALRRKHGRGPGARAGRARR